MIYNLIFFFNRLFKAPLPLAPREYDVAVFYSNEKQKQKTNYKQVKGCFVYVEPHIEP